jgi:hypothetical protein
MQPREKSSQFESEYRRKIHTIIADRITARVFFKRYAVRFFGQVPENRTILDYVAEEMSVYPEMAMPWHFKSS